MLKNKQFFILRLNYRKWIYNKKKFYYFTASSKSGANIWYRKARI